MKKTVAIIGAGRMGGAIGSLLARAGMQVMAIASRSMAAAERVRELTGAGSATTDIARAAAAAEVVFITTPDGVIRSVCETIASSGGFRPGMLVVHTSGAHGLELLDAAQAAGAWRAVMHPLQSVPNSERGREVIPGSSFRIETDAGAETAVRELLQALGGIELVLPRWQPGQQSAALYHAGAVAVSNYLVALIDYGLRFFQVLGAEKREALHAVLPLIRGTLDNIERLGTTEALTGPIARGDGETVRGHLAAMRERAPELLPLYRELARHTVAIAREKGTITGRTADDLCRTLEESDTPPDRRAQ